MQTDAEAHADLQRDFDTDIELCGQVEGIDIFVGGHAHRGIEQPYVHPKTGSLIVQTYGYGTRLGYLKVWFEKGQIQRHEGSLLKVWSDELEPDPMVVARLQPYRDEAAATIGEVLGDSAVRLTRDYPRRVPLGQLGDGLDATALPERGGPHQRRGSESRSAPGNSHPGQCPGCSSLREHSGRAAADWENS